MKAFKLFFLSSLILLPPLSFAQDQILTDIFPRSEVQKNRTEIEVSVENVSNQSVFCEYIASPVHYKSSQSSQPWPDVLITRNIWIAPQSIKTFLTGASQTDKIRKGIYPDAIIDSADSSINVSSNRCFYKKPAVARLESGGYNTCAIMEDNSMNCWGMSYPNPTKVDIGSIKGLSMGRDHSCAINEDDKVFCWGENSSGELGTGNLDSMPTPDPKRIVKVGGNDKVRKVSAGSGVTCVILESGQMKCWGDNQYGQLGLGQTQSLALVSIDAINLGAGRTAVDISAGNNVVCAVLDDKTAKCWGSRSSHGYEVFGDKLAPDSKALSLGAGQFAKKVFASNYGACVLLESNKLKCFGESSASAHGLDANTMTPPEQAVQFDGNRGLKDFSFQSSHACALMTDGSATCWGNNYSGQAGGVTGLATVSEAVHIPLDFGGLSVSSIVTGYEHTCALLSNNTIKCWGQDGLNQLGHPSVESRAVFFANAPLFAL